MDIDHHRLARRVQFWAMLGPLSVLFLLLVTIVKADFQYLTLPLVAVVGIGVCWKWKMRGLLASGIALILLLLFFYPSVALQDRYWLVGMSMAIALGLIATVLSLEESEEIVSQLNVESQSRLENLMKLDEKYKQGLEQWRHERQGLVAKVQELSTEITEKEVLVSRWEQAVHIVRQDLDSSQVSQDRLLEELFEKRTEMAQMRQQIQQLEEKEKQIPAAPEPIIQIVEVEKIVEKVVEVEKIVEVEKLVEVEKIVEKIVEKPIQMAAPAVERAVDVPVDGRVRQLEGMYRQLRQQFEDKSGLLDETRRELFHANERCEALKMEMSEHELMSLSGCESILARYMKSCEAMEEGEEVEALQSLVEVLLTQLDVAEERANRETAQTLFF